MEVAEKSRSDRFKSEIDEVARVSALEHCGKRVVAQFVEVLGPQAIENIGKVRHAITRESC